ncbi:glycosyltransferase [Neokomagataea thailandica]|uniref:Dolichol-phosphate mannosyltransferase n=1 Tax=Neokomagataea tanensis NBRC 106556 TaxID=1223519 RepID=A0ABQ0QKL9_9PROT|nr:MULTISPECIES: glycosyltransferase family 2 protein [Neokomagataea]GBR48182.1 dolichol-phosphate mannosyltransferase [Neokomagataea tanensis NBRC 106556]
MTSHALAARLPAQISVVVPCYNEVENVPALVGALEGALGGIAWEVIFVDDNSPDGTAACAARLAQQDPRIRVVKRVGRRGLSTAVIEGILASSAPYAAVMDGDLQHDESILPEMLRRLQQGADLVVASRHIDGGDNAGLANRWRHALSNTGIRAAHYVMPHHISDPMSGFFALRRPLFDALLPRLSGAGFKILLDLAMSAPMGTHIEEVPFVFRPRQAGESKLDMQVLIQFAFMLLDKVTHGRLPTRFLAFAIVGLIGVFVNVSVLHVSRDVGLDFSQSQLLGTFAAILANFYLNNRITYHDKRLRGRRLWSGLMLFVVTCSVGAVANIGIARMALHDWGQGHWSRSSAAGAVMSVVWNYAVSSTLVWR